MQNQSKKKFPVHRVIGRYEIDGAIICIPAPRPGVETALVKLLIDERVENLIKKKMVEDLFSGDPHGAANNETVVLRI
jgi:hypothetical protein